jgi:hypothetical protein
VLAGAPRDLPRRCRGLPDGLGDLAVVHLEDLAEMNTARSVGPSVSSTVNIAIETLSASSTSSATSGLGPVGDLRALVRAHR